jgi:hypothetical protein
MVQIAGQELARILRGAPGVEHGEPVGELAGFFLEHLRIVAPLAETGYRGGVQRHGRFDQTSRLRTGSRFETEIRSGVALEFPRVAGRLLSREIGGQSETHCYSAEGAAGIFRH